MFGCCKPQDVDVAVEAVVGTPVLSESSSALTAGAVSGLKEYRLEVDSVEELQDDAKEEGPYEIDCPSPMTGKSGESNILQGVLVDDDEAPNGLQSNSSAGPTVAAQRADGHERHRRNTEMMTMYSTASAISSVSSGVMKNGSYFGPTATILTSDSAKKDLSMLISRLSEPVRMLQKAFVEMTESVLEVIHVSEVEVHLPAPPPSDAGAIYLIISVESWRMLRCCGRWTRKPLVFSHFAMALVPDCDEDEAILRTGVTSWQCRVPRRNRLQGNLFLRVRVMVRRGDRSPGKRVNRVDKVAVLRAGVPYETGLDGATVELLPEDASTSSGYLARVRTYVMPSGKVFDLEQCRPMHRNLFGHSEWRPAPNRWRDVWTTSWEEEDFLNRNSFLNQMTQEMKNDIVLMYQTLFSQSSRSSPWRPTLLPKEEEAHDMTVLFLKRLILALAVCRLSYSSEANGTATRAWPFPLAAALTHGGRILVRLDGVPWHEFLNFLLYEDVDAHDWASDGVPKPFMQRLAATHETVMDPHTSQLMERRLRRGDFKKNLSAGYKAHHLGLDIPLGGLGNPTPATKFGELFVGPAGVPFYRLGEDDSATKWVKEIQHGHLYVRWDDFGDTEVPVLVQEWETEGLHSAATASSATSRSLRERAWSQMPTPKNVEDLRQMLEKPDHELNREELERLYKTLAETKELVLERNEAGITRAAGVLIHLVIEMEEDGENKVLIHMRASARAGYGGTSDDGAGSVVGSQNTNDTGWSFDDVRVPTLVRRRQESWVTAVMRFCQTQLHLSAAAAERVVEGCRLAEEDMSIYKGSQSSTFCFQHGTHFGSRIQVEYDAYRFKFHLQKQDRHLFIPVLKSEFNTDEYGVEIGAASGERRASSQGTIVRDWAWMDIPSATDLGADGLHKPSKRLAVQREKNHLSSLLLGVERSAPLKEDFFGGKHSVGAQSKDISAFGKRKWRDFRRGGQEVPADLGGIMVTVDPAGFSRLRRVCDALILSPPSAGFVAGPEQRVEKQIFRDILQGSDEEVGQILRTRLSLERPNLGRHANTQVMESFVLTRSKTVAVARSPESGAVESLNSAVQALHSAVAWGNAALGLRSEQRSGSMELPLPGPPGTAMTEVRTLAEYSERLRAARGGGDDTSPQSPLSPRTRQATGSRHISDYSGTSATLSPTNRPTSPPSVRQVSTVRFQPSPLEGASGRLQLPDGPLSPSGRAGRAERSHSGTPGSYSCGVSMVTPPGTGSAAMPVL